MNGKKIMGRLMVVAFLCCLAACQRKAVDDRPQQLLAEIEQLYTSGHYQAALDSIVVLRSRFPNALAERKRALRLWQEASEKLAQEDIALTDSALQATTAQMNRETRIYERNMLGVKRDSLQARYEALSGEVRIIRKRMEESAKP